MKQQKKPDLLLKEKKENSWDTSKSIIIKSIQQMLTMSCLLR